MTFSIQFLGDPAVKADTDTEVTAIRGEIRIDDYREIFVALIGYWYRAEYEAHWRSAIERLIGTRQNSCLITSLHDPKKSDLVRWWLLYPAGDSVRVQEGIQIISQMSAVFDAQDPFSSIPAYTPIDEDGRTVSEWEVPLHDFQQFLSRQFGSLDRNA